jgi:hypothetical protein
MSCPIDVAEGTAYVGVMTKLLEPILASPELPRYVQQLNEVLARERGLRQKFYEGITEQQKAEFINGQVVPHSLVQRKHSLVSDFLFKLLSTSTEKNGRGVKFEDYAAHGVGEYWLVDPQREQIEKCLLRNRRFGAAGTLRKDNIASHVIAGFEVPVKAVFHREANLCALRRLLA